MPQVCVSQNLTITGPELGIAPWSVPRHVLDQTFTSVGDGSFSQQTTLPGKLMIDSGVQSWTNSTPLPARVLLRIQRGRREWQTSNPNVVQIRDRYTTSIGTDNPITPDPSSQFNGHSGGGLDGGTNESGTPLPAVMWEWEDPTLIEDWFGPIAPGEDFRVWYRCYLWTPPPWSNNANNNNPLHSASVHNTRIQMIAFPVQDIGEVT